MLPTVGIIGLRGHALRLREALEPIARVTKLYHPSRKIDDPRCTLAFEDLLGCDCIVIASPNDTHFGYLRRLHGYDGYVYCEKPPTTTGVELQQLSDGHGPPAKRLMFGYTYRYSKLNEWLQVAVGDGHLGRLVSFSATMTHGLAFKPGYATSWRADGDRHRLGVTETLGVHFLDIALRAWAIQGDRSCDASHCGTIASGIGTAPDTSRIRFNMHGGGSGDILVSYAAPYHFDVTVIGTDGMLVARDGELSIRAPRDTFDARGFFTHPPHTVRMPYQPEQEYEDAVGRMVRYLINVTSLRADFIPETYDTSWAMSAF